MARKPRIEFEGAFYHVIVRGNQGQKIFKGVADFNKLLAIIVYYKKRYNFHLYCYVLMSNHVHFLMETKKIPLSKILQGINQSYTMYFNRKYQVMGHLFQGRYKAILCDKERYLLSLVKYIHLNPVRARIVKIPEDYRWSSHSVYLNKLNQSELIDIDQILKMFSENKTKARKYYREYIHNDSILEKSDVYNTIDQRVLGNEEFAESLMEECHVHLNRTRREKEFTLTEIAQVIKDEFNITLKQIQQKGKSKYASKGKVLMSIIAHELGYAGKQIAAFTRKDPSLISKHLSERLRYMRDIEKVMKRLKK